MIEGNKRIVVIALAVLAGVLITGAGAGQAFASGLQQDPTPTPQPAVQPTNLRDLTLAGQASFTFTQFEQPTFILQSPSDLWEFSASFPYRWALTGGLDASHLELRYDVIYEGDAAALTERQSDLSVLTVFVDDLLAATFTPVPGVNQVYRVPIPPGALEDPLSNNHVFRFSYFGGDDCLNTPDTHLVIKDSSLVNLRFSERPFDLSLARFPLPLVDDSFISDQVTMVIPDEYTDADLTAMATVSGAVGRYTFSLPKIDVVTGSQALASGLANRSAVIIGNPSQNAFLNNMIANGRLSVRLDDEGQLVLLDGRPLEADDGVLQLTYSDQSTSYSYLVVTGNTDEAIQRAAEALARLDPTYGLRDSLAVFDRVSPLELQTAVSPDRFTLEQLDLRRDVFYGVGAREVSVDFFLPRNWALQDGASLHLEYVHSAQLAAGNSGISVLLNGSPIGSAPVTSTVQGTHAIDIPLPQADLRPGDSNRLTFRIFTDVEQECVRRDTELAWIRLLLSSYVYLPHSPGTTAIAGLAFGDPFSYLFAEERPDSFLMALPAEPSMEDLTNLADLSKRIGNERRPQDFEPVVTRGASTDMPGLDTYHVVAFGLPTENPLIAAANDNLLQSFEPGTNNLQQEAAGVIYRLPADFSIGLVQVVPSPWNETMGMTVITGTTKEGMQWAFDASTDDTLWFELIGELNFVRTDLIESFRAGNLTRSLMPAAVENLTEEVGATPAPILEVLPTPTPNPALADVLPAQYQPVNIRPTPATQVGIGALIVIGLGLAAFGIMRARRSG